MSAGNECDNCRRFGTSDATWLYLVQQPSQHGDAGLLSMLGVARVEPLTFCSMLCVAQYAYVAAVAAEAPLGTEPPPRSGIGWPQ